MPAIDLSILNQRQTPAFYADTLANRPSAGFIGRIFVSTNTFEFYRDNGTTWDLIGGPGTSTVTGTGANGQVTYWNGTSSITGSNDLFFDAVNGHLGVGTITPGTALDVKHNQNTVVQLEQETATNDTRIAFINSGVGLWRLGAFYNAGANDFGLFDIAAAAQPVTVKRTTGQVLIGTSTVGSGKLVVASATGDNGVQIVGASAPSLRIDNAESGPTKRAGLGISTATNNFIQGSADRDFCMFNGSTTASPILFGIYGTTNVQEAARISAARNFLIGTTTDGGQRLQISGSARATSYYLDGMTAGTGALYYAVGTNRVTLSNYNVGGILEFEVNGGAPAATILADFSSTFNNSITAQNAQNTTTKFEAKNTTAGSSADAAFIATSDTSSGASVWGKKSSAVTTYKILTSSNSYWYNGTAGDIAILNDFANGNIKLSAGGSSTTQLILNNSGNLGLGVTPSAWSGRTAIQLPDLAYVVSSGASILFGANVFFDGTTRTYIISDFATDYRQINGEHRWEIAPSGTAGTPISPFTQAMTLKATGNLLIGTTTDAGQKLQVNGTALINGITTFASTAGNGLRVYGGTGTNQWDIYLNSTNLRVSDNTGGGSVVFDTPIQIGNTVTASVLNTVTNKVSIVIGGVQYYLLASTSAV